jgi:outer membrane protein TolC
MNAASLALDVARKGEADARRTLEGLLRQTYLGAVAARQALATQKEAQDTLSRVADLNRARYQHGSISEVEVLKVETEKLTADQEVERAQQALNLAKAQVAFMLGARGRVPVFEVDPELPELHRPSGSARCIGGFAPRTEREASGLIWRVQESTANAQRHRFGRAGAFVSPILRCR